MYAKHKIGVIVPLAGSQDTPVEKILGSIPAYVDRVYILKSPEFILSPDVVNLIEHAQMEIIASSSKDEGVASIYQKALDDGMDITAFLPDLAALDVKYLHYLLDPIVWGNADFTKGVRYLSPENGNGPPQLTSSLLVSEVKIALDIPQVIEPANRAVALSRLAMLAARHHISKVKNLRALVGIPCYNESVAIGSVILKAHQYVDVVLVVDDGSTDDTTKVAEEAGAKVISHGKNRGYGAALATCFEYARNHDFDVLITLDGDGQHDPSSIPSFLSAMQEKNADVVLGSRFLGDEKNSIPMYRRSGMKILDVFTDMAGTVSTTDSQCGFRAYGKRAIDAIQITNLDMGAGSEILTEIASHDLKVVEVPVKVRYDIGGTSKQNPVYHGLNVMNDLLGLIGYRKPLIAFGVAGMIFTILGMAAGFYSFSIYYSGDRLPFGPTMIAAIFLFMGVLLIDSGLILNSLVVIMKKKS